MPQKIENIDPNFRPQANTAEDGFCFRPLWEWENVVVDGLFPGTFCRIDPAALPRIPSEGVRTLAWHTAGGTVRFRVPGGRFFVRMMLRYGSDMSHMPRSGSGGLDVYCGSGFGRTFCAALRPASSGPELVAGEIRLPAGEEEALLHLPLYDGVKNLELGFPEGVTPQPPTPYRVEEPVVFYGSSITQGGCASRPGNAYPAMISRMLDCSFRNLGFSGNAKGEPEMADYIAGLRMSAFVYDYDHNAPDVPWLARTHLPFLQRILAAQPELPVVLVSKPDFHNGSPAVNNARRDVILRSFLWARENGYRAEFVDGAALFSGPLSGDCTVDGCHPNDLGFSRMAAGIAPALARVMGLRRA